MQDDIICTEHVGVRFIDSVESDIRTTCDRCGKVETQDFGKMNSDPLSDRNCEVHGCPLQRDMLGEFCVYCILEKTAEIAESLGYEFPSQE